MRYINSRFSYLITYLLASLTSVCSWMLLHSGLQRLQDHVMSPSADFLVHHWPTVKMKPKCRSNILTCNQLVELVCNPSRSWWLWPASQSLMPVPAHWRQHSKRSMLSTSVLGSYVWKTLISSPTHIVSDVLFPTHIVSRLIVSEIQHQERPHQHHL